MLNSGTSSVDIVTAETNLKLVKMKQSIYANNKKIDLGTDAQGYRRALVIRAKKRFIEMRYDVKIKDAKTGTAIADGKQKQLLPCH